MEDEKKPGKYEGKSEKSFWKKIGKGLLEIVAEVLVGCICFAIGAGIFVLLGKEHFETQADMDLLMLLGSLVLIVAVCVVAAIINHVKKKKNK